MLVPPSWAPLSRPGARAQATRGLWPMKGCRSHRVQKRLGIHTNWETDTSAGTSTKQKMRARPSLAPWGSKLKRLLEIHLAHKTGGSSPQNEAPWVSCFLQKSCGWCFSVSLFWEIKTNSCSEVAVNSYAVDYVEYND